MHSQGVPGLAVLLRTCVSAMAILIFCFDLFVDDPECVDMARQHAQDSLRELEQWNVFLVAM